jgi:hypothetical protein
MKHLNYEYNLIQTLNSKVMEINNAAAGASAVYCNAWGLASKGQLGCIHH